MGGHMKIATETARALDPVILWRDALGFDPDPWQADVLRTPSRRICLLCSRQAGKSQTAAVKALHLALYQPGSLVLLVSRSLRQSVELGRKVFAAYDALGYRTPPESQSKLALELRNRSRILCLPGGDEGSIRGYSAAAIVIDEAARCPDSLFVALRPMTAISQGALILLSSPFGARGFFHRIWTTAERWYKVEVTADHIPRLSPEFLVEELAELGPDWFSQEYMCQFIDPEGSLFAYETVMMMTDSNVKPIFDAHGQLLMENL
jgi:hypothetical protein